MGRSSLQGTPWHYERLKKPKNAKRRHKSRCKFYVYPISNEEYGTCNRTLRKCIGSSICEMYKELSESEFKEKSAKAQRAKRSANKNNIRYTNKFIRNMVKKNKNKK